MSQPSFGTLPVVAMATLSAFDGNYRAWGRIIAANGVAVAMVDFRNSVMPSSALEVAAYPAGLNDCVAGLHWVVDNAETLGIDPGRVTLAGESGGGNLSIATTMRLKSTGELGLIRGLYAMCPYIAGEWPQARYPSSTENNGILLSLHDNRPRMGYGIEAFEAKDPMAWPGFATVDDVRGFPKTMISVNECDPLRDEGIEFYRLLLEAGVAARCRQVMGTIHGTEIFAVACPEVSRETAASNSAPSVDLPSCNIALATRIRPGVLSHDCGTSALSCRRRFHASTASGHASRDACQLACAAASACWTCLSSGRRSLSSSNASCNRKLPDSIRMRL